MPSAELNVLQGLEPTLPSSWYLQDHYFQLEKEHIFFKDWAICERVQQSMNSRVHERGVYAAMEDFNLDIRKYLLDRLGPHVNSL